MWFRYARNFICLITHPSAIQKEAGVKIGKERVNV
jgi:hypothetical protein